jgi:RNA polymerase sigma-70 factor (ECF subfamily)
LEPHEALEALVNSHQSRVQAIAFRILGSRHEAEDVAQEAFLRAYELLKRGEAIKNPGAWLARVTTNLAIGRTRLAEHRLATNFDPTAEDGAVWSKAADDADPGETAARRAVADLVWRLSAKLPARYRAVLALRTIEQMDYPEIAEALAIGHGNARMLFSRAREALRREVIRNLDRRAVVTPECKPVLADLPRFLDNQLPTERMREVAEHLSACRACALTEQTCRDSLFGVDLWPLLLSNLAGNLPQEKPSVPITGGKSRLHSLAKRWAREGPVRLAAVALLSVLVGGGLVAAMMHPHSPSPKPRQPVGAKATVVPTKHSPVHSPVPQTNTAPQPSSSGTLRPTQPAPPTTTTSLYPSLVLPSTSFSVGGTYFTLVAVSMTAGETVNGITCLAYTPVVNILADPSSSAPFPYPFSVQLEGMTFKGPAVTGQLPNDAETCGSSYFADMGTQSKTYPGPVGGTTWSTPDLTGALVLDANLPVQVSAGVSSVIVVVSANGSGKTASVPVKWNSAT